MKNGYKSLKSTKKVFWTVFSAQHPQDGQNRQQICVWDKESEWENESVREKRRGRERKIDR